MDIYIGGIGQYKYLESGQHTKCVKCLSPITTTTPRVMKIFSDGTRSALHCHCAPNSVIGRILNVKGKKFTVKGTSVLWRIIPVKDHICGCGNTIKAHEECHISKDLSVYLSHKVYICKDCMFPESNIVTVPIKFTISVSADEGIDCEPYIMRRNI